jgi:hypothetical protein
VTVGPNGSRAVTGESGHKRARDTAAYAPGTLTLCRWPRLTLYHETGDRVRARWLLLFVGFFTAMMCCSGRGECPGPTTRAITPAGPAVSPKALT